MTLPVVALRPNWRDGLTETWTYRTEVQQAHDGREIRRSLRNLPRRTVEFSYLLPTGTDREAAARALMKRIGLGCRIPLWMDAAPCSVSSGATSFALATDGYDYAPGGEALIWESPSEWHVCEGLTVSPGSISWTNATAQALTGRVMPLRRAVIDDAADGRVFTVAAEELTVRFLLDEDQPLGRLNTATYSAYLGRPVYALASGEDDRRLSARRRVGEADFGVGARRRYEAWTAAAVTRDFEWTVEGRSRIGEALEWVHRHRGRWGWFWWDTWGRDLEITSPIGASDTTWITAAIPGFPLTQYGATPPMWRRDITLRLKNGTVYRRRLTGWTATSVTVDSALGAAVAVGDIDRVSWLQPTRFDNDAIELRWETTTLLRFSARFRGVLTV